MISKRFLYIATLALLILTLAACERPASQAPTGGSPTVDGFPVPGSGTDDVMGQLESFATQTAIAMQGGAPSTEATAAPTEEAAQPPPTTEPTTELQAPQPPPAQVVVPTATPGTPSSYTLQKGEHPFCIARRFNVNPYEMLNLSGLSSGGTYAAGTVLKIPKTGNTFPAKRALKDHPTSYTVRSGDTIYTIACDFGDADPNAIIAANSLVPPYKLGSGDTIQIP